MESSQSGSALANNVRAGRYTFFTILSDARRIMRFVLQLAAAVILFVSLNAFAVENDPFLREIASVPRPAGKDRVSIADIAAKYIPAGTEVQEAIRYLEERGFRISPYEGKNVPAAQKWFLAEREERQKLVLAERTRVIIESDGKRVLRARGWVFLVGI
jgi:hypothetical protein